MKKFHSYFGKKLAALGMALTFSFFLFPSTDAAISPFSATVIYPNGGEIFQNSPMDGFTATAEVTEFDEIEFVDFKIFRMEEVISMADAPAAIASSQATLMKRSRNYGENGIYGEYFRTEGWDAGKYLVEVESFDSNENKLASDISDSFFEIEGGVIVEELVDLVIEDVVFPDDNIDSNGNTPVEIKVCNRGTEKFTPTSDMNSSKGMLSFSYGNNDFPMILGHNLVFQPGQCHMSENLLTLPELGISDSGSYSIIVNVDSQNIVNESNETNNSFSKSFSFDFGEPNPTTGTHLIDQCARVMNIDKYPNYTFIAFYKNNPSLAYIISNGACLRYGTSMSEDFALYYTPVSDFTYSITPDHTIRNLEVSEGINEHGQRYYYPTNLEFLNRGKLVGEFIGDNIEKTHKVEYHEYSITQSNGKLSLYKSNEIFRDTKETEDPVIPLVGNYPDLVIKDVNPSNTEEWEIKICNEGTAPVTARNNNLRVLLYKNYYATEPAIGNGQTFNPGECHWIKTPVNRNLLKINSEEAYFFTSRIDPTGLFKEWNEKNNTFTKYIDLDDEEGNEEPNNLPDLEISEFGFLNYGNTKQLHVKICNKGDGTIGNVSNDIISIRQGLHTYVYFADIPFQPGECTHFSLGQTQMEYLGMGTPGNYTVTARVDPRQRIQETTEANNTVTRTMYIYWENEENSTTTCTDSDGGRSYYETGTVRFYGANGVYLKQSTDTCATKTDGNTFSVHLNSCEGENCYVEEKYCIDGEDNYGKDFFKCRYGCQNGRCLTEEPEPATQADLVIKDVKINPSSIHNKYYDIDLTIKNQGSADAISKYDVVRLAVYVNDDRPFEFKHFDVDSNSVFLRAGEEKKFNIEVNFLDHNNNDSHGYFSSEKKSEFRFFIDANNYVRESNEGNNKFTKQYPFNEDGDVEENDSEYEDEVITSYFFPDTEASSIEGIAAAYLRGRHIIGGFPDGEFKGERDVNRAELSKFLLLSDNVTVGNLQNNGRFADVVEGEWYTKYVMKAAALGIVNGYPDGTFRPANTVNTAEFLKMITETFGLQKNMVFHYYDASDADWFGMYAGVAEKYNLFPHRDAQYLEPARELTRNEVAVAIHRFLTFDGTQNYDEYEDYMDDYINTNSSELIQISTPDDFVHKNTRARANSKDILVHALELSTNNGSAEIESIKFRIIGNGTAANFDKIWIESAEGGVLSQKTEINGDMVTIYFGKPLGVTTLRKQIFVKVDMAEKVESGQSLRFVLYLPEWVDVVGSTYHPVGFFSFGGHDIEIQ